MRGIPDEEHSAAAILLGQSMLKRSNLRPTDSDDGGIKAARPRQGLQHRYCDSAAGLVRTRSGSGSCRHDPPRCVLTIRNRRASRPSDVYVCHVGCGRAGHFDVGQDDLWLIAAALPADVLADPYRAFRPVTASEVSVAHVLGGCMSGDRGDRSLRAAWVEQFRSALHLDAAVGECVGEDGLSADQQGVNHTHWAEDLEGARMHYQRVRRTKRVGSPFYDTHPGPVIGCLQGERQPGRPAPTTRRSTGCAVTLPRSQRR